MELEIEIKKSFPKIEKLFTQEELLEFKNTSEEDLCLYHFSLGLWIRNNFLYGKQSRLFDLFLENGIGNADDMSSYIIKMFHHHLNT